MNKGIKYFSVFCFSTENWNRTPEEIGGLFDLARAYLVEKKEWYKNKNIKVVFRGNKSKLPSDLFVSLVDIEEYTKNCTALTL
jgi:undecaprenyl diphosphate synthase